MSSYATGQRPTVRTRKPTGRVSWPLILLAGEAKSGKTYLTAQFSGDERIGRTFWLDLGEGCADEYGAVPGADYEIIDHDGTWIDIIRQVEAVRDIAQDAQVTGENPVMLVIDSITAEWAMLSAWTDTRARRSASNRKLLEADPDAEIDITANYWNDANSRHNRLMNILKTFPGIVVMTALETEKTQFGADGRPVKNAPKVARPDAQKRVTADATAWIRLSLESEPTVVGLRSVKHSIRPGKDRPTPWEGFTLAKLVFDFLGIGSETAAVRNVPVLDADQHQPGEQVDEGPAEPEDEDRVLEAAQLLEDAGKATDRAAFVVLWKEMNAKGLGPVQLTGGELGAQMTALAQSFKQAATDAPSAEDATPASEPAEASGGITVQQRQVLGKRMFDLGVHSDQAQAILAADIVGRPVRAIGALTGPEADKVLIELDNLSGLGEHGRDTIANIIETAAKAAS